MEGARGGARGVGASARAAGVTRPRDTVSGESGSNSEELQQGKFQLYSKKNFCTTIDCCPEKNWNLPPWRRSELSPQALEQPAVSWSCLEQHMDQKPPAGPSHPCFWMNLDLNETSHQDGVLEYLSVEILNPR